MEKMITLGTRVSGKYSNLIPNPKGDTLRWTRVWILGNITKSVSNNWYEVTFDNSIVKELYLSSLRIKESNLGIPIEESVTIEIETTNNKTTNNTIE